MRPRVTAAILAGGGARRFGGADKSALVIGGRSILERQLTVLREVTPHIVIVANDATRYESAGVPVVPDRLAHTGALGGLYTAIAEARGECVLVVACDMPFLTAPFLHRLVALGAGADGAVPRDRRGRHPLCAAYAPHVAAHLEDRLLRGERRVLDAIEALDLREIGPDDLSAFDPDGRLLANINTGDDYAAARAPGGRPLEG